VTRRVRPGGRVQARGPVGAHLLTYSAPPVEEQPEPWPEPGDPRMADRLAAAERLDAYEARVLAAARAALTEWTGLVSTTVLRSQITAAAGDGLPPDPGAIPPLSSAWDRIVNSTIVTAIRDLLGEVFAALLQEDQVVSARPWQEEYLATVVNRLSGVPDDTFTIVRAEVQDAIDLGESIPKIRDRVEDVLASQGETTWENRAQVIARTETIGAYNGGHLAAWAARDELTGATTDKVWLATIDSRTRDSHFRADGQRVRMDRPFRVGGFLLMHPGDPTGPASEVIQCRCTMLDLEADEDTPDTAERQLRDPADVQGEIDRRAEQEPEPVIRAYDDPAEQDAQARSVDAARALTASTAGPAPTGQTVTAAGSGPGVTSAHEGRTPMPRTWRSDPFLAPFAEPTGDGRIFKVGSLTHRDLPLPLLYQESSAMGHDGSIVVGRILDVEFTDAGIVASGDYLDAPEVKVAVGKAMALVEAGLGSVSVDLAAVVGELVDEDGNPISMEDIWDAWDRGEEPVVLDQVAEGELIACTQVATPAFAKARIVLDPVSAEENPAGGGDGEASLALQDAGGVSIAVGDQVDVDLAEDGSLRGEVTAVDEEAETVTVQPLDDDNQPAGDPVVVAPSAVTVTSAAAAAETEEDAAEAVVAAAVAAAEALVAGPGVLRPPADWFTNPNLPEPTPITITDEGRIYGHVAVWGTCHVGFSNTCVTPPTSPTSYAYFHTGEVVLDDGSRVAVGNLTLGGRHADVRMAYRSAIEHYDVQGAGTGIIRLYEDEHGIAMAGAVAPGTTEEQVYDMRRSPVSGDWRRVAGELELIGVLSVNAPGFPTPRFATDESGRTALTAAASVRPADAPRRRRPAGLSQQELTRRITETVRAGMRQEVRAELRAAAEEQQRRERLERVAASIRRDPRKRVAQLAAQVTAGGKR